MDGGDTVLDVNRQRRSPTQARPVGYSRCTPGTVGGGLASSGRDKHLCRGLERDRVSRVTEDLKKKRLAFWKGF